MNRFNLSTTVVKTPLGAVWWEAAWQRYRMSRLLVDNRRERVRFVAMSMAHTFGLTGREREDFHQRLALAVSR